MKRFIVLLLVCCLGAAVTARPIRGTVKCAGTPVSGVTVTEPPLLHRKRRRRNFHPRRRRRRAVHQHRNPFRLPGPHGAGHPQFFRPYAASTKRYDFERVRGRPRARFTNCWRSATRSQNRGCLSTGSEPRSSPNCNARPPSGSNGARHRRRCCSATSSGTLRSCSPASASSSHRSEYRSTA